MQNYFTWISLALILIATSCTKVNSLSDSADIESIKITSVTEGIEINMNSIRIQNNTVILPLDFGRKHFPLNITTEIDLSSTTEDVIGVDKKSFDLREFTFNDVYTPQSFYLIAESGVPHLWKIMLEDKKNAEIESFKVNEISLNHVKSITIRKNNVRISLTDKIIWPITILPEIQKTSSSTYKNYREGEPLTFTKYNDIKEIILVADNGDERVWQIEITSPIENCDFELWIKDNIDPIPGHGLGWATANNSFVRGTTPINFMGGKAAQMKTSIQDLGFIGLGQLIASGTLYTGYFSLNMQLDNPRSMTYFGIPFRDRPVSISVDAQYFVGKTLQRSVKTNGSYKLVDVAGVDEGHIWVELLHWSGEGDLKYHAQGHPENLTVLGRGEHLFRATDANVSQWQNYVIPIQYNSQYNSLEPTHIAIVMTSSKNGDTFIGAVGSTLNADNVVISF